MRSKVVVWAYLIVLSLGTMLSLYMPKTEAAQKESIVIPGEAIRLRILANSDFEKDQAIKRKVRDAVNAQITLWVQDLTSMEKARAVINEKLPEIQAIAEQVVREQNSNQSVKVEFGKVQFPTKLYGQFLYPAGEYQAILITLGKGEGANWWCVLYPPLCFLDFSNGIAVSKGFDEKEHVEAQTVQEEPVKAAVEEPVKAKPVERQPQVSVKAVVKQPKAPVKKETVEKSPAVVENYTLAKQEQLLEEEPVHENLAEEPVQEKETVKQEKKPVYTAEDEQPVKVKFFVVEMWEKLFN
ncbi:stage II sporulation protein R [Paenibacillus sp. BSR1-1]|uniref:stage II sporulation protein R n=1 Tax=Paenibacillus sp. BSR1-1 TaxID=3020845 RepID=UPI0025AF5D52|nr:stage II sporulation protein R [Paenibacillus sp. BSR1-1]MDN3018095.1 stage II sporulation protein R [Paenibacillus sp. BSR1-1]